MKLYDNCIRAFIKGNLGDDLFIYTLCKRYPEQNFVICGEKKYRHLFENIKNLKYISEDSFFRKWTFRVIKLPAWIGNRLCKRLNINSCFRYYHSSDSVYAHSRNNILVSGSIFMEIGGKFSINPYYKGEIKYYSKKPYVMGCNFGPYETNEYRSFYEKCFKNASQVSFRDEYSYSLFKNLENVSFAPDILFNTNTKSAEEPEIREYVLVSVLNPCKDEGFENSKLTEMYIDRMAKISDKLRKAGKKIVFIGFCEFQKDGQVIERIIEKMNGEKKDIKVVKYPEITIDEALGYIKKSEFVIATRYHAMILAEVFKRPVLPVIYNEKMLHVIEDITPDMSYISINECEKWDCDEIAENIINKKYIMYDMTESIKNAEKHFEKLDRCLKAGDN